jgi:CRISPR-associated endonuclease/helicase Cas3
MNCISHPNKKLFDHLNKVKEIGLKIFDSKININFNISNSDIRKVLEIVLFYHDFGKSTEYFQNYIYSQLNSIKYDGKEILTHHALLSSCVAAYKVYNTLKNSEKKELLSLIAFIAVRKHHSNFENIIDMLSVKKWDILEKQFNNIICDDFKKYIIDIDFNAMKIFIQDLLFYDLEDKMENYFLLNFVYSILTYSDKIEAAIGDIEDITFPNNIGNIVDYYKEKKFSNIVKNEINNIRENLYMESYNNLIKYYKNEKIFSLNIPTGGGKTLIALNLAFKLLEKDENIKKIIYVLPYTSIIDQTEKIIKDIIINYNLEPNNYLLTHHHMAEAKIKYGENDFEGNEAQLLIESWDKPIVLTTFWQLFNTLISNKNSQMRKFHNLTNSVIILDEIQTIPYEYWYLTKTIFLKLVEIFNCKIIFLTATMPLIFREDKNEIMPLIDLENKKIVYSKFNRYKINILNNKENEVADLNIDELLELAIKDINSNKDKSFLFVFNTIKNSKLFFKLLKDNNLYDKELIYLSTNILPKDRKNRIEKIKKSSKNKIVVSTQLIEAGVDIDLDIIYRDFSIFDSIIQTAGRCNRNNKNNIGEVKIFKLINENNKYDYEYIYENLQLMMTKEIISNRSFFYEKDLLFLIDRYFKIINEKKSNNLSNELLMNIKSLNYEFINNKFKLIEEVPSELIYIEIDNKSSMILNEMKNILNILDPFEKKSKLLKIKNEFYQYTLSVRKNIKNINILNSFPNIGNLRIVEKDYVAQYYKEDIGLDLDISNFI